MDTLMNLLQLSVVQIILVAYIGALFGEMKKEVDDDEAIHFGKFLISWMSSGFGGVMVGLLLRGTISKDNVYVVLGGAGLAGYAGQQKSIGLATRLLTMFIHNEEKKNKPPARRKPAAKKKKTEDQDKTE